jgi:hypothetical protein
MEAGCAKKQVHFAMFLKEGRSKSNPAPNKYNSHLQGKHKVCTQPTQPLEGRAVNFCSLASKPSALQVTEANPGLQKFEPSKAL